MLFTCVTHSDDGQRRLRDLALNVLMVVDHAGGNKHVAPEAILKGGDGLLNVPRDVPTHVDDSVP